MLKAIVWSALAFALTLGQPIPVREAARFPAASPASQGFAPDRLERLHARLQDLVDQGQVAGLSILLLRNGHEVDAFATGLRDREAKLPFTRDTIVRIYSMSKIVTSVAALILIEEGRLRLDDPVSRYLPELAGPQIWKGGAADAPELVPAQRSVTIRHLLTHTAGYGYGFGDGAIDAVYQRSGSLAAKTLDEFVRRAASLPLAHEPGERFLYGINTDLLGAVIQRASGQPLPDFIRARITGPLGMPDTAFSVPASKRPRLAKLYARENGGLVPQVGGPAPIVPPDVSYPDPDGGGFPSGGGGLFSTLDDYARFAQMLLNGGELDGVRILGRKTVETMRSNHLHSLERTTDDGFGYGVSVRQSLLSGGPGSPGQFGWNGAATTTVNIDPQERLVALLFTQHFPFDDGGIFDLFSTMMYTSLVDASSARQEPSKP